ncbi:DUF1902 domain-containing protein [Serratia marcescens]|uniref:DUF1902 domain-containing protein n=1 Tax=Serratia marcescens TaxID=615 RepID=UPI000DFA37DE|nr:DUF1902 domain-containing protein [Serratia marcescens]SUI52562.1 Domain of uncharacterised function (DUF1902) [Serratia marcescens]
MDNIYIASFGNIDVRFVNVEDDVFVSQGDFIRAMETCLTDDMKHIAELFVSGGVKIVGDASDSRSAILGDSVIGPAIHFHAVGNILTSLVEMNNEKNPSLRESCFRMNSLLQWYSIALSDADEYFGRGVADLLSSVKRRLDRLSAPYTVHVLHDKDVWVASCDELGLVTEAPDYESLTERVWEVAEELLVDNDIDQPFETLRLSFVQNQVSDDRMAL